LLRELTFYTHSTKMWIFIKFTAAGACRIYKRFNMSFQCTIFNIWMHTILKKILERRLFLRFLAMLQLLVGLFNIAGSRWLFLSWTVYNSPNTEKYRVNKIHIGRGDIFRIRTIVYCVTNLSWFCNQASYLMFSILGQWIYHDFESIKPRISFFNFIKSIRIISLTPLT
jgi:hypothetical protein